MPIIKTRPNLAEIQNGLSEGLEKFITRVEDSITVDQILAALEERLEELEVARFAYVLFFPHSTIMQLVLTNYPQDWCQYYSDKRYSQKDMIPRLSLTQFKPFSWTEIAEKYELNSLQKSIMAQSSEAGLRTGGTIPLTSSTFEQAFLAISTDFTPKTFEELFRERRHELHLMGMYIHEKIMNMRLTESLPKGANLTPRECEVLTWMAQGKSMIEVSIVLEISAYTVDDILNNIRRKFQCVNTAQAIAIAAYHRLIVPMDSGIVLRRKK